MKRIVGERWTGWFAAAALWMTAMNTAADPVDQSYFTGFNFNASSPFVLGSGSETATFDGGFAGTIGVLELYHSGTQAWNVSDGSATTITFGTPASRVQFWAGSGNGGGTINVFAADDALLTSVVGLALDIRPGAGTPFLDFDAAALGAPAGIGRIVLDNDSGSPAAIDDFGFTPVPEPSSALLLAMGAPLLWWLWRKRHATGSAG